MALRCASGGGGAYLMPPRSRCCGAGAARPKATTTKARGLGLLPRVASSCSKARQATHLGRNIGRNEGWEALKGMVQEMFSPLVGNLSHMGSLRTVYDLEDYEIGMLSGALLGSVGCYQLCKAAPSVFLDTVLAYAFYKLSVVSSELHRQGKCNDLLTRLKFGTILVMVLKDIKKNYVLLDLVRMPVFLLYICAFLFDVAGIKKDGRAGLVSLVNILKQGGVQEVFRIMLLPGYVSPYDDGVDWSDARA